MSMEAVRDFSKKLKQESALQAKVSALSGDDRDALLAEVVAIASGAGFSFTTEEFEAVTADTLRKLHSADQINEAELERIAGGAKNTGYGCTSNIASLCMEGKFCN